MSPNRVTREKKNKFLLSNITVKDRYPILLISNLTDQLSKAKFFTKMDLRYGYHLVQIADGDEWKTAFSTRHRRFEYKVMPLGLCNAPAVFQKMMNTIFYDLLDRGVIIYLDNILTYGETEKEVTGLTLEVLKRLREHKLFVKPRKCQFLVLKVKFLGVIVAEGKIEMDPGKLDAIKEWPAPTKVKEGRGDVECFVFQVDGGVGRVVSEPGIVVLAETFEKLALMSKELEMVVDLVDLQAIFGLVAVVEFDEIFFVAEEGRRTEERDRSLAVELQFFVYVVVVLEEWPVDPSTIGSDEDVGVVGVRWFFERDVETDWFVT